MEQVSDLLSASAGYDLSFSVAINLRGNAPESVRADIDRLLGDVTTNLKSNIGE